MKTPNLIRKIFFLISIFLSSNVLAYDIQGYVNVDGGKIWYGVYKARRDSGNLPIIIVHGSLGATHDYLKNLNNYSHSRDVIFYDQLGSGKSSEYDKRRKDLWTLNRFTNELDSLIKNLHYKAVIVYGHAFGGAIALNYALNNQNIVEGLILASPMLNVKIWKDDIHILLEKLPKKYKIPLLSKNYESDEYKNSAKYFNKHHLCRLENYPKNLTKSMDNTNSEIYQYMIGEDEFSFDGSLTNFNILGKAKDFRKPVLFTSGKFDKISSDAIHKILMPEFNKAVLVKFERSSHMAHLEEEIPYLRQTLNFIFLLDKPYKERSKKKYKLNPFIFLDPNQDSVL